MIDRSAIWVTWEHQTRNRSMSMLLGIPLFEIVSEKKGLIRYVESLFKTLQLIRSRQAEVVFCQNPSIVLSLFCVISRKLFRYKVIVDEHNAGLYPLDGQNRLLNWIARYIVRTADAVIVTNTILSQLCESWGGNPLVLEDPLPDFSEQHSIGSPHSVGLVNANGKPFELLFICTWASDEPYLNVLEAAKSFSAQTLKITITGNYNGKIDASELPPCIHLTGFVSKSDYVNQLASTDGVLVLTNRQDCLNCGAYEAVSLLKPGILSDTSALRNYFSSGFLFTDNTPIDIIYCIESLITKHDSLLANVERLRSSCKANDIFNGQKIRDFLAELA